MKIKTAISASYHRDFDGLMTLRDEFENLGLEVLFPLKSTIKSSIDDFVILSTDKTMDCRTLQNKNLKLIEQCDFLYVYNPDGYVGLSVALEIGYALRHGIVVYSSHQASDITISKFVIVAADIKNYVNKKPSIDTIIDENIYA